MHNIVSKAVFGKTFSRLDAEYVERTAVSREEAVREAYPGERLVDGVVPSSAAEEENGHKVPEDDVSLPIRYVAIDSVDTEDGLSFESLYDSPTDLPSRAKHLLQARDILVSNVRPNRGAVAFVRADQRGALASSGFTLVRLKSNAPWPPEYVFAVLKTPYAREQLVRRSRGSMYPAVLKADVLELFVPDVGAASREKIVELVKAAEKCQADFFEQKRSAADRLAAFLQPIGAPPSPTQSARGHVDTTEIRSQDIFGAKGARRFDAEFFRGEYAQFDAQCSKYSNFLLGEKYELNPGRSLGPSEASTPYAKQAVLTNVGVNWSALDEEQGALVDSAWRLQKNDVLLACTAHEIPYVGRKVDVVTTLPEGVGGIGCVPDLMVLRPRESAGEISHHYVAAFLRCPSGLHQVQRCIRGLRGGHVYKDDLSRFVRVPLPPTEWMNNFDAIEEKAQRLRAESKRIIAEAVHLVTTALSKTDPEHAAL